MLRQRHSKKTKRPDASSDAARQRMRSTRQRDTPCELALRSALRSLGLRYRVDMPIVSERVRPDIAFPNRRVAVFVDGCFWHGCPEHGTWPKSNADWWRAKIQGNIKRDRKIDRRLRQKGWIVLRFWAHEDMGAVALTVASVVRDQVHQQS